MASSPETEKVIIMRFVNLYSAQTIIRATGFNNRVDKMENLGMAHAIHFLSSLVMIHQVALYLVGLTGYLRKVIKHFYNGRRMNLEYSFAKGCYKVAKSVLEGIRGPFSFTRLPAELRHMILEFHAATLPSRLAPFQKPTRNREHSALLWAPSILFVSKDMNREAAPLFISHTIFALTAERFPLGSFMQNPFIEANLQEVSIGISNYDRDQDPVIQKLKQCPRLRAIQINIYENRLIGRAKRQFPANFFKYHFNLDAKPWDSLFYLPGIMALLELRDLKTVTFQYGYQPVQQVNHIVARIRAEFEAIVTWALTSSSAQPVVVFPTPMAPLRRSPRLAAA